MSTASVMSTELNAPPRDGRPVPRWAVRAAHLVPLVTLPSGLWRIALVAGVPLGYDGVIPFWEGVYIVGLSVVSEALALLTLGLVRPWGEVFPRWLPLVGGRRVPPLFAVTAATAGAAALTLIWWNATITFFLPDRNGFDVVLDWGQVVIFVSYVPLVLWGPLLFAVTWAYYRRRCRD